MRWPSVPLGRRARVQFIGQRQQVARAELSWTRTSRAELSPPAASLLWLARSLVRPPNICKQKAKKRAVRCAGESFFIILSAPSATGRHQFCVALGRLAPRLETTTLIISPPGSCDENSPYGLVAGARVSYDDSQIAPAPSWPPRAMGPASGRLDGATIGAARRWLLGARTISTFF